MQSGIEKQYCRKGVLRIILTISLLANIFDAVGQTEKGQNFPIPESIIDLLSSQERINASIVSKKIES